MFSPGKLIQSPVTGGPAKHLTSLSSESIAKLYQSLLRFDISPHLDMSLQIELYECLDTGYQFYTPLDHIEGTPQFYENLYSTAGTEWGYEDDKWEHKFALRLCSSTDRMLDIGCGGGAFLRMAHKHVRTCIGLETSPHGLRTCQQNGVKALAETIQTHCQSIANPYDIVCAFQVMEHVSNVRSFLESCIKAIRRGGKLVLSVPNNDGFIGTQALPLNLPPHHVGRWGAKSLESLARVFNLELIGTYHEPLQPRNIAWYKSWIERSYLPRNRLAISIWHRLGFSKSLEKYLEDNAHTIHGHTVMAAYKVRE